MPTAQNLRPVHVPCIMGSCLVFQTQGVGTQTSWDSLAASHGVGMEAQKLPFLPFLESLNQQSPCIKVSYGHTSTL